MRSTTRLATKDDLAALGLPLLADSNAEVGVATAPDQHTANAVSPEPNDATEEQSRPKPLTQTAYLLDELLQARKLADQRKNLLATPAYWQDVQERNTRLAQQFLELKHLHFTYSPFGVRLAGELYYKRIAAVTYGKLTALARRLKLGKAAIRIQSYLARSGVSFRPPSRALQQGLKCQAAADELTRLEKLSGAIYRRLTVLTDQQQEQKQGQDQTQRPAAVITGHPQHYPYALITQYEQLERATLAGSIHTALGECANSGAGSMRGAESGGGGGKFAANLSQLEFWQLVRDNNLELAEMYGAKGDNDSNGERAESNYAPTPDKGKGSTTNRENYAIAAEFRRRQRASAAIVRLLEAGKTKQATRRIRRYWGQGVWSKLGRAWAFVGWLLVMLVVAAVLVGSLWVLWSIITNFGGFWTYMTA